MQFLRTLLIVFTVGVAVAFAIHNWTTVPIALWGGLIADINLPLLMVLCFLGGLLPTWIWHQAVRWRLRQRLAAADRAVADLRVIAATPAVVVEPVEPPVPLETSTGDVAASEAHPS